MEALQVTPVSESSHSSKDQSDSRSENSITPDLQQESHNLSSSSIGWPQDKEGQMTKLALRALEGDEEEIEEDREEFDGFMFHIESKANHSSMPDRVEQILKDADALTEKLEQSIPV